MLPTFLQAHCNSSEISNDYELIIMQTVSLFKGIISIRTCSDYIIFLTCILAVSYRCRLYNCPHKNAEFVGTVAT
jgi:hypothetical protein